MQVIIPTDIKEKILTLHEIHFGIIKMKVLPRLYMWCRGVGAMVLVPWWLGIIKTQGPLHLIEFTTRPWQRIHLDFAGHFQCHIYFIDNSIFLLQMARGGASEDHNNREGYSRAEKYISMFGQNNCYQDNGSEEFLLNLLWKRPY